MNLHPLVLTSQRFRPRMLRPPRYVGPGMAAGGSRINSNRRGAKSGRGVMIRREGQAPLPSLDPYVPGIESLEEICEWLGTFRERLRAAHAQDAPEVALVVQKLEARYLIRRV